MCDPRPRSRSFKPIHYRIRLHDGTLTNPKNRYLHTALVRLKKELLHAQKIGASTDIRIVSFRGGQERALLAKEQEAIEEGTAAFTRGAPGNDLDLTGVPGEE
jgi:hypothetical protein